MSDNYIIANWKANIPADIQQWIGQVNQASDPKIQVGLMPPTAYLSEIHASLSRQSASNHMLALGTQDVSLYNEGANTGEVPVSMLRNLDVVYYLIGHSERRAIDLPSQETIAQQIDIVIEQQGKVVFCIGENLDQYTSKKTTMCLDYQLEILSSLKHHPEKIVIAYEPIWAIGTGKTPTLKEIDSACKYIRIIANKLLPKANCTVLYGGSLKLDNCQSIFALPNVNGGLIGGASLDGDTFYKIFQYLLQAKK